MVLGELLRGTGEKERIRMKTLTYIPEAVWGGGKGLTLLGPGLDLEPTLGGRNQVQQEKSEQEMQACG